MSESSLPQVGVILALSGTLDDDIVRESMKPGSAVAVTKRCADLVEALAAMQAGFGRVALVDELIIEHQDSLIEASRRDGVALVIMRNSFGEGIPWHLYGVTHTVSATDSAEHIVSALRQAAGHDVPGALEGAGPSGMALPAPQSPNLTEAATKSPSSVEPLSGTPSVETEFEPTPELAAPVAMETPAAATGDTVPAAPGGSAQVPSNDSPQASAAKRTPKKSPANVSSAKRPGPARQKSGQKTTQVASGPPPSTPSESGPRTPPATSPTAPPGSAPGSAAGSAPQGAPGGPNPSHDDHPMPVVDRQSGGNEASRDVKAGDLPWQAPDSQIPDSQIPDSQIPSSQNPDSQIPDSQNPNGQTPNILTVDSQAPHARLDGDTGRPVPPVLMPTTLPGVPLTTQPPLDEPAAKGWRSLLTRRKGVKTLQPRDALQAQGASDGAPPRTSPPLPPGHPNGPGGARGGEDWQSRESTRAEVIAVWGPIGSPGRSTVALNVAVELAGDLNVILIDADTYGPSLAQLLGTSSDSSGLALAARAASSGTLDSDSFNRLAIHACPGLRLISGLPRPERWIDVRRPAFEALLQTLKRMCDVIIIDVGFAFEGDTGASLAPQRNGVAQAGLSQADCIVAVTSDEPIVLTRFIRDMESLRQNWGNTKQHIVVNRKLERPLRDDRGDRADIDFLLQDFGRPTSHVPGAHEPLRRAMGQGLALKELDRKHPARAAYQSLAATLASSISTARHAPGGRTAAPVLQ